MYMFDYIPPYPILVNPYFIKNPSNGTVVWKNTTVLECSAAGFNITSVTWFFNGTIISDGSLISSIAHNYSSFTSSLTINSINIDQQGEYHCVVSGNSVSRESSRGYISVIGKTITNLDMCSL